jgi:hypothetical protein
MVVENGTAAQKVQFRYDEYEDKVYMCLKKGGGSVEDAMEICAENYTADVKDLTGRTLNIVFKVLDQAISTCDNRVLEVKIGENNGTTILRVADVERNIVTKEVTEEHEVIYMCV